MVDDNPLEFFPTPPWQTRVLLRHVPLRGVVLEPCAGDGAIADVIARECRGVTVLRNDLVLRSAAATLFDDPDACARLDSVADATSAAWWRGQAPDWTVTNPPFTRSQEILEHAVERSTAGVAFLLRLSYLEPPKEEPAIRRARWLQEHPPNLQIYMPRGSYSAGAGGKKTTDLIGTFWGVWYSGAVGREVAKLGTRQIWITDADAYKKAAAA